MSANSRLRIPARTLAILGVIFVILIVIFSFSSNFFYFLERVDEEEIGVQFQGGRITDVVGPGIYSDTGLFVELKRVPIRAIDFVVTDEELITKDKQRIGLIVTGDVFRPTNKETIQNLWGAYNDLYLDDTSLRDRIQRRAQQAMKVCVGDRNFDDAVIGTARDELRGCIDAEVNKLAENFGLKVENVAVPEVILSSEVQAGLDAIVRSRLETEQAQQDERRALAQALAEQARQEGEIRIEQSRIQEESRQQRTLAELEETKIKAQRAVIEAERANELARVEAQRAIITAEKDNELLAAERDLEIETARALAASERAQAEVAIQAALAELYLSNPRYLQLQIALANADALEPTDKVIFTPEGTTPTIVLPGPGIVPTIETSPSGASDLSENGLGLSSPFPAGEDRAGADATE